LQQRYFFYAVALLAICLIQKFLLDRLAIFGAKPDLILIAIVYAARRYGQSAGTLSGFTIGLITDLMYGTLGVESFAKTIAGFTAGFFSDKEKLDSLGNFLWAIAVAAFFGGTAQSFISSGLTIPLWKALVFGGALSSVYNVAIAYPLFILLIKRL
jgi:rod shape-determining protein MreD